MKRSKGFTLIELMLVLSIIGILSILAIPAYNEYLVKAKLTELVLFGNNLKLATSEYYYTNNEFPSDAQKLGFNTTGSKYIKNITVQSNGVLRIEADNKKLSISDDTTLALIYSASTKDGILSWTCETQGPIRYAPSGCKKPYLNFTEDE